MSVVDMVYHQLLPSVRSAMLSRVSDLTRPVMVAAKSK